MLSYLDRLSLGIPLLLALSSWSEGAPNYEQLDLSLPPDYIKNLPKAKYVSPVDMYFFGENRSSNVVSITRARKGKSRTQDPTKPIEVLGLTERQALQLSGVVKAKLDTDVACGPDHIRGDVANVWCHTVISTLVTETLNEWGVHPLVAYIAGVLVFVVKEFAIDLNPHRDDITGAPIYLTPNAPYRFSITPRGDGVYLQVDLPFSL